MRYAVCYDVLQPFKPADAMFDVNDIFADIEGRYVGNKVFGRNLFVRTDIFAFAPDVLFRNNKIVVAGKAVLQFKPD